MNLQKFIMVKKRVYHYDEEKENFEIEEFDVSKMKRGDAREE